ncbi:MAG: deacylase [Rhodospirillaceae bacterium]|jgi:uncharacterized protein|nr:deacylase [Rhodospirillaceae bacterium]MBT7266424.1 deacylase [Rhodospirillaceae bacterium]
MSEQLSSIEPTIDLSAQGAHKGFLKLPHSVHRSALGYIPIPVVNFKNGTGPTVLLTAGTHGDEYEGQVTLTKLVKAITPDQVTGQIIIVPMTNFPAAKAGLRTSPIDDLNLNREFPGDPFGSPTRQIAHYVETVLMAMADHCFDIHSGGSSLHTSTTVLFQGNKTDKKRQAKLNELVSAIGAPYALELPSGGVKGSRASMSAAARQGAIGISGEFGGSGTVTPISLASCEDGVRRYLIHLGVWSPKTPPPAVEPGCTEFLDGTVKNLNVYADRVGLFEPVAQLDDRVEIGQTAGFLHHPDTPWQAAEEIKFEAAGVIIANRIPGLTERGDGLFQLGAPVAP